jgi:hypothetical protein
MKLSSKVAGTIVAGAMMTVGTVGITGTPALAAYGPCYAHGSFSFKNNKVNNVRTLVDVFHSTNCTGGAIGTGQTSRSGSQITLSYWDTECDNLSISVYVHGFSISSNPRTCGTQDNKPVAYSAIGDPKNFWVNVGGSSGANSDALAFPVG